MVPPSYDKKINFEKFATQFSKDNTTEIFDQLTVQEYKYGREFAEDVMISFLASFIASSVYKVLRDVGHPRNEEEYKERSNAMIRIKTKVQHAVATGFQGSISTLTGEDIEYYCSIQPVPDMPTKMVS